jgi:hypothetical protein
MQNAEWKTPFCTAFEMILLWDFILHSAFIILHLEFNYGR